jgi:hypothetical protein
MAVSLFVQGGALGKFGCGLESVTNSFQILCRANPNNEKRHTNHLFFGTAHGALDFQASCFSIKQ